MASMAWPSEKPGPRLKEIVTAGNWPWRFTESDSLSVWKCAKALSGTGVCVGTAAAPALATAALPPATGACCVGCEFGRDVPSGVVTPEAALLEALAVVRMVLLEDADAAAASAAAALALEVASVVWTMLVFSGEVVATAGEPPDAEEGVSRALPVTGAAPDPAAEDEPAVFDTGAPPAPAEGVEP